MADRRSARTFGKVFEWLASLPSNATVSRHELVKMFWSMRSRYDFSPCQMECDMESLEKLGLARKRRLYTSEDPAEDEWEYQFLQSDGTWE